MQVKTGLRAGVTAQEVVTNVQRTVGDAAQTVSNTAQDAGRTVQTWLGNSRIGDTLNKAFWFPFDPPK
jgi:hypothetical protein